MNSIDVIFEENIVMNNIFKNARSTEPRGFLDVYSEDEVMQMWSNDYIVNNWTRQNRDWLDMTAGLILDKRLGII